MGLIPAGTAKTLLQWYDTGGGVYALRNRTMDDLLDEIAATGPTAAKYYLDISQADISATLNAASGAGSIMPIGVSAGATLSLTAQSGTGSAAAISAFGGSSLTTALTAVSGAGSSGGVTVAAGAGMGLTAASGVGSTGGVTVSGDTTAPTVTAFTVGTPSGSSVPVSSFTATDTIGVTGYLVTESSTPPSSGAAGWSGTAPTTYTAVGTGSVTLYPWAKDAAGNVSSVFGSPRTVTISGGAMSVSDTFTGGDTSPLPGNWATIAGSTAMCRSTNAATSSSVFSAARRTETFANNQYAECSITSLGIETGATAPSGPIVRASASAATYYFAEIYQFSDDSLNYWQLWKCVGGVQTQLGTEVQVNDLIARLEANGTSIKLRSASTHGGPYTDRISVTDSSIASGSPGLGSRGNGSDVFDNFYGGDL